MTSAAILSPASAGSRQQQCGGTRKDAERELTRLLRTADTGEHVDPSRMTVRQWLETWLDAVRSEISPKAYERYSEIVRCYLVPALGQFLLTKLAPIQIQNAYSAWATGGRRDGKPGGLSSLTRRYVHVILKSALGRAVEQQLLARNPAEAFKNGFRKSKERKLQHSLLNSLRGCWPRSSTCISTARCCLLLQQE
jgi:hypothetical protein